MPPTPLRDNLNDMAARTTRAAEKARIDAARRRADEKVRAQRRAADARSAAFEARRAVATFRCRGDGLRRCVNGRRASFAIDAPHKNLKFFAALESATHRYELDVVEDPDGTYACSYVVAAPPGPYELSILLDDEIHVPGSPFAMTVAAGAPCVISGPREAVPGEQLDIDVRDAYGHATAFDLRVEGPATAAGNAVSVRLDAGPGAEILVHASRDGRPIRGSPLAVRVVPAPPPPAGGGPLVAHFFWDVYFANPAKESLDCAEATTCAELSARCAEAETEETGWRLARWSDLREVGQSPDYGPAGVRGVIDGVCLGGRGDSFVLAESEAKCCQAGAEHSAASVAQPEGQSRGGQIPLAPEQKDSPALQSGQQAAFASVQTCPLQTTGSVQASSVQVPPSGAQ